MKRYIFLFLSILIAAFTFTGCVSSPEPLKVQKDKVLKKNMTVRIYGNMGADSEMENLAVMLTEVSKQLEAEGFHYFVISNYRTMQLKKIITNMKDLERYCYPAIEIPNTSLENKCSIYRKTNYNIGIEIIGFKELGFKYYRWSTKEVLNDPIMKKYYTLALKGFDNKEVIFEEISFAKMYRKIK